MLPPLADLADLEARLGVALDPESASGKQALAAINDASALARAVTGEDWLDDITGDLTDPPDAVVTVVLAAAMRALRNPQGVTQASVGDVSLTFGTGQLGSAVYLTKGEIILLRRALGEPEIGSVEMTIYETTAEDPTLPAPVQGGGDTIPLGPVPWE